MKLLLPSKDDLLKLRFEGWKWVLVGLLAFIATGILTVAPSIRDFVWNSGEALFNWAVGFHTVRGLWILVGGTSILALVVHAIRAFRRRANRKDATPEYVGSFTRCEYDGVVWEWKWLNGKVDVSSMKSYCPKCETELIIRSVNNQYDGKDTSIFCTACNKGVRISNVGDLRDHARRKIEGDARTDRWRAMQHK